MVDCDILSKEQCMQIIKKYAQTTNFQIKCYSVNPLKSQMDGLVGEQYTVRICYQIEKKEVEVQFFLKILQGSNPIMFDISKTINAYEKEEFYYQELIPLLQSSGFDADYAPSSYFCEPYLVVLEDLSLLSYKGTNKSEPLDMVHCKKCLETLAKFHAEPIMYEIRKSREIGYIVSLYDSFKDILEDKVFSQEENGATKFMRGSVYGLLQLIDIIPENGINNREFKEKFQKTLDAIMSGNDTPSAFRSTVIHGDLWSNNFLYRYKNQDQDIIDCKLIDFQTIKYGPPALDVLQFILTNTRREFREKHQNELLTYYYNYFSGLLTERGFRASEILSEVEFKQSSDMFKLPAKIQAVIDRSITFIPDEMFLEAARTTDTFMKFIFEERGKFIIKAYQESPTFRELMLEDLIELREMLFT